MPQEEERREPRAASPLLEISKEEVLALSSLFLNTDIALLRPGTKP